MPCKNHICMNIEYIFKFCSKRKFQFKTSIFIKLSGGIKYSKLELHL